MTTPHRRNALRLGTALATSLGTLGAASGPAAAQSASDPLPVVSGNQGPSFGAGAGTVITPAANSLDVNLNDQSRVINWQTYNVAAGNTVSYATGDTTTQFSVLNRVTGTDANGTFFRSIIDGTINGQSNIAIWLTNPAGITFGSTGAFNGGSLALTTLNIGDTDFLDGGSILLDQGTTGDIALDPGSALTATGLTAGFTGAVLLAAPAIVAAGSIQADGDVALVAAQEVSFASGLGSPLSMTITEGTQLSGVNVLATGTINGQSVALVAANASAAITSLLNVDGGATLTATGNNGAVVLATADTGGITMTTIGAGIDADGALIASGTNGDVIVAGSDAVSLGGEVFAGGDYTATGTAVTLGGFDATAEQAADGSVSITSTAVPITLAGNVNLTALVSGTLTGGVAGGGNDLMLDFPNPTAIDGATYTGIGNLSTGGGGTTTLTGTLTTTGSQTFGDTVFLVGDTTLVGSDVSFADDVDGSQGLTVNASGVTIFGGEVGRTFTLTSLTTDAAGATALNGGLVLTTGTQTFGDALTLGADTLLLSFDGVQIGFGGTLDGAQALTVVTSGVSSFGGVVGGTIALTALTTTGGGNSTISGGAVTTTGAQSYGDPLSITADTVFTGGSGTFSLGLMGGGNDATLNFGGTTVIQNGISGVANLSTGGGGTTWITGIVTTTGSQNYGDAVTLGGAATLTGTEVSFGSTVDGAQGLTVNASGTTSFGLL